MLFPPPLVPAIAQFSCIQRILLPSSDLLPLHLFTHHGGQYGVARVVRLLIPSLFSPVSSRSFHLSSRAFYVKLSLDEAGWRDSRGLLLVRVREVLLLLVISSIRCPLLIRSWSNYSLPSTGFISHTHTHWNLTPNSLPVYPSLFWVAFRVSKS